MLNQLDSDIHDSPYGLVLPNQPGQSLIVNSQEYARCQGFQLFAEREEKQYHYHYSDKSGYDPNYRNL